MRMKRTSSFCVSLLSGISLVCLMVVGRAFGQADLSDPRDLFAGTDVLEVEIEIAEPDWDLIRSEGRSLPHLLAGCDDPTFEDYTRVLADVLIDGESVSDVSIRKKGFLGSLSMHRPSFRLDYGRDDYDGRTFHGTRRITLNNNLQDSSNAKQCIAYELFAEAGLPAPRCGLARVTVNGVDKGFYTNVEPIKKDFLRRHFDDDDGNLYELTLGDFVPDYLDGFELKTNNREDDRSDLDRIIRALEVPDEQLIESLSEVFDFDELITFWAMEVLVGHWDGMTGNRNNSYIYHDPTDDRFHPIPWGTDGSFQQHQFVPNNPQSVYAFNSISQRLYGYPETRRIYQDRLRQLLDTVWDEDRIVARLREIAELTQSDDPLMVGLTEGFIVSRRQLILNELDSNDGNGPEVSDAGFDVGECREPQPASGIIDFTWNDVPMAFQPVEDLDALAIDVPLAAGPLSFVPGQVTQLATINAEGLAQFGLAGMEQTSGGTVFFGLLMPVEDYQLGEVPFHGAETLGVVIQLAGANAGILGMIGGGSITFDEISRTNGEPVRGRWQGIVAHLPEGVTFAE